MPWTSINQKLKDDGLEGARRYLATKKGIPPAHCVFHNGTFHGLRHSGQDYQLYILAHGCSDAAAMTSGEHVEGGKKTWGASKLASELLGRGLPGDREARIKLCLCHSAQPIQSNQADPILSGIFAQHLARELYRQGSGHDRFTNVYVGGFTVPVSWAARGVSAHLNQLDTKEYASRVYYRCDAAGTQATNHANASGLRPFKATATGANAHRAAGGSKWNREAPAPSAMAAKYAYFPFAYEPDPLPHRV